MNGLLRIYGLPHELLHALALRLIGRRPLGMGRTHIDIPADLSTRQFVFVAGFPAVVFGGGALLSALALLNAPTWGAAALALLGVIGAGIGAAGTIGDIELIVERLIGDQNTPMD